tara:strand:+ start:1590 stop:2990 length:1401 start_codon:yes stop_codon:yes gene_type:complete
VKIDKLEKDIEDFWDANILPTLTDYIKIPNKSPAFDPDWKQNGHMDAVLALAKKWIEKFQPDGSTVHIEEGEDKTPMIIIEIPGERDGNILMYGHLDKQPEMEGWKAGLGPWTPVYLDDKLYGRGGADDGYALFASLGSILSLKTQGVKLPRIVILIEFSEESGSPDLPYYMDHFKDTIGNVDLVICLDSGAGNYEQFWSTVSLRGMISCNLKVEVLSEGVHSGNASGMVPSSFRLIRQLISRLEDESTGEILVPELHCDIPDHRYAEADKMASALNGDFGSFPWHDTTSPMTKNSLDGLIGRTWKPTLSVVGSDGIPSIQNGGNVLRPYTKLKLSFRLPPTVNCNIAMNTVDKVLRKNPPNHASVSIDWDEPANGWNAPKLSKWLEDAIEEASQSFYHKPAMAMGEGGTIPFMAMLGEQFPAAQFVVTGVLGPNSNAHGPNEFIHIPFAKKLSASIAFILDRYPS